MPFPAEYVHELLADEPAAADDDDLHGALLEVEVTRPVPCQRTGSIEFRIHKHAEVHETVPAMFLLHGIEFAGSPAIGDFDSEHISACSQHRLIPRYELVGKIAEEPVRLL